MSKLPRSPKGKEKIAFWLLNPASKLESLLLTLFFLLLPTQLGKHFWPDFSTVSGIRIDYLSPIIYVTDVLLILLFGSFVFPWFTTLKKSKLKSQNSKLQFKSKNYLYPGGFIFLFLLSNIIFSPRPLLSFYDFVKLAELSFLIFYLAHIIRHQSQLQYISLLFAISAVGESLLAIFQYLNQGSLNGIFYFFGERAFTGTTPGIANASINGSLVLRPYATFPHPNVLAGYLLLSMVLTWSFVLKSDRQWMQTLGGLSLLISSVALLLTFSRVTILLWVLMVFILLLRTVLRTLKKKKTKIVIGTFFLVIFVAVISFVPFVHEVFMRFAQTSLSEESVTERTALLSASWKMIQQHPLLGVGLDSFIPALAPLQKPLPLNLYLQPVHNIFVLITAEVGVIGLVLFTWLLVATSLRIRKQQAGIKETFFVLLLVILVTGMFDHYWLTLQQGQLLFATVLGLSWAKVISKNKI